MQPLSITIAILARIGLSEIVWGICHLIDKAIRRNKVKRAIKDLNTILDESLQEMADTLSKIRKDNEEKK